MKATYDYHEIVIDHEGKNYRVLLENGISVIDVQRNIGDPDWNDYADVSEDEPIYKELVDYAVQWRAEG